MTRLLPQAKPRTALVLQPTAQAAGYKFIPAGIFGTHARTTMDLRWTHKTLFIMPDTLFTLIIIHNRELKAVKSTARSADEVSCWLITRDSPIVRTLSGDLPTSEITLGGGVFEAAALAPHTCAAWACSRARASADDSNA